MFSLFVEKNLISAYDCNKLVLELGWNVELRWYPNIGWIQELFVVGLIWFIVTQHGDGVEELSMHS